MSEWVSKSESESEKESSVYLDAVIVVTNTITKNTIMFLNTFSSTIEWNEQTKRSNNTNEIY